MSQEAHQLLLTIEIWEEQGDQMGISAKLVTVKLFLISTRLSRTGRDPGQ